MYMEISQGYSLRSYLYLKGTKMRFFLFSTELENRKAEQVLPEGVGLVPVRGWRWQGKGVGG
jgi:hypothetical protein